MRSSEIPKIVDEIKAKHSPYRCILISGDWGIGKTYQIKKACENENYTSLFGLKNTDVLYKSLITKSNAATVLNRSSRLALKVTSALIKHKTGISLEEATAGFISIKEYALIKIKSSTQSEISLFIFDDLERMSNDINIEEVLGVFDSLLSINNVRIIIVANKAEIRQPDAFNRYCEKVVDHIYEIDELPEFLMENDLRYDHEFLSQFCKKHSAKNIRTLQKAQCFYEDVSAKVGASLLKNEEFKNLILMVSYGVVVEEVEHIYWKDPKLIEDPFERPTYEDKNVLIASKYVFGPYGGYTYRDFVEPILNYYSSGKSIQVKRLYAYYKAISEEGDKANFFKSKEEISDYISLEIEKTLSSGYNIEEIIQIADNIFIWQDIINEHNAEFEQRVYIILKEQFINAFSFDRKTEERYLELIDIHNIQNEKFGYLLNWLYLELEKEYCDSLIYKCNNAILSGNYNAAKDYSKLIKDFYSKQYEHNEGTREYLSEIAIRFLLIPELSPSGSISEEHFLAFQNIIDLCIFRHKEETEAYIKQCIKTNNTDVMLKYRLEYNQNRHKKSIT